MGSKRTDKILRLLAFPFTDKNPMKMIVDFSFCVTNTSMDANATPSHIKSH